MQYQVSTLNPMNILNVPIPSSLFHFCPNLARLPHYAVSGFLLVKVCACCLLTPCKCVPLVDLLNGLLWVGQNGLPPTPNILHLGCSYHLHSSHRFLFTWGEGWKKLKTLTDQLFIFYNEQL